MEDGWSESAEAWIAEVGDSGDWGRKWVLDQPMLARVREAAPGAALDVGCGEGRFCRMLSDLGIAATGIDPTEALLARARMLDPDGDYRLAASEALPFEAARFDLVVAYLSLIDIPDLPTAIAEMVRVLRPGGRLLIANLTSLNTAGLSAGWISLPDGRRVYTLDRYMEEHVEWCSWSGIRVRNWHRPLSTYMGLMLESGLVLRHFAEPVPSGGDPARIEHYVRAPWFLIMEWQKPA